MTDTGIETRPVDESRWDDLVTLFGPSGTQRGCWCMTWRLPHRDFTNNGNAENRAAMRAAVCSRQPVGLLGYQGDRAIAWCALAPRSAYQRILRSPHLSPDDPDEGSVWSAPCFFIKGGLRRRGIASVMLDAAVAHAGRQGASVLEGYPVDTDGGRRNGDIHSGTIGLFRRNGFSIHRRPPSGRRVVMRKRL